MLENIHTTVKIDGFICKSVLSPQNGNSTKQAKKFHADGTLLALLFEQSAWEMPALCDLSPIPQILNLKKSCHVHHNTGGIGIYESSTNVSANRDTFSPLVRSTSRDILQTAWPNESRNLINRTPRLNPTSTSGSNRPQVTLQRGQPPRKNQRSSAQGSEWSLICRISPCELQSCPKGGKLKQSR